MTDENNELIDKNLTLICESISKNFLITKFIDSSGEEIGLIENAKLFADKLENLGLISVNREFAYIEDFGLDVYRSGGWLKHIEKKHENDSLKIAQHIEKQSLEFEKLKIEFELAKKNLNEFPKTKWFARIAFIIATLLGLKELALLVISLLSKH